VSWIPSFLRAFERKGTPTRRPYLLGTQEFRIINHTDCGKLQQMTGTATVVPFHFYAFSDLEENVRQQIQQVRAHPWIPQHIPVRGFIYDVKTGRLKEVST
jgi:carbonic anhydrase